VAGGRSGALMDGASWHGRSVLVTGADGLIGSYLSRRLLEHGAEVVAVRRDRPPLGGLEMQGIAGRVNSVAGDICDEGLIARALAEYEVTDVFHLAAQTLVGVAARAPASTFETNVRGTWVLLEACRARPVEAVVVAASDKAYGRHEQLPYTEDAALAPRYPYDVSKAAADLIARSYWHTFGLPVAVTRLANVYGGGDLHRSRLIPEAIGAALHGRAPVLRSDGSPERDFLYVEDAVTAYLAVHGAVLDGRPEVRGEAFNAGSGAAHRVGDVVALICRLAGSDLTPEMRGPAVPPAEIDRQWLDSGKLARLTGWRAATSLEDGLRRTLDWFREHPGALARLL
jgi:CDP-glucose 4,6-dehydratase